MRRRRYAPERRLATGPVAHIRSMYDIINIQLAIVYLTSSVIATQSKRFALGLPTQRRSSHQCATLLL